MKAAVFQTVGSPLVITSVPDPVVGTGEVIVDVVATTVLPYANEVFSGKRKFLMTLPAIPGAGAIGRVRVVGPDATRLASGDWVSCDPTVRSRDGGLTPDIILQGLTARGEGGLRLQKHFQHGSFAEQMLVPTENVFPLTHRLRRCWFLVRNQPTPCAIWWSSSGNLQAGETVLVSGATGNFGSSGVAVALAMEAGCVVAPGRNEVMLEELVRRFGPRVRAVKLTGDETEDGRRMKRAAPGPIDCVLDLLPPSAPVTAVRAAAMTVREYGRILLMGGVGSLGGDDLGFPYPWIMRNNITLRGQWMYPPEANSRRISLVKAGLLDLKVFDFKAFGLEDAIRQLTTPPRTAARLEPPSFNPENTAADT